MNKQRIKEIDSQIAELEEKLKNVKGTECEYFARAVGYYRSPTQFNKGLKASYKDRKMFNIDKYFEKSS